MRYFLHGGLIALVHNGRVTEEQKFQPGDTVRLRGGIDAHLMTVKAASQHTVLCCWFGHNGKVQFAPYAAEDLERVDGSGLPPQGPPT